MNRKLIPRFHWKPCIISWVFTTSVNERFNDCNLRYLIPPHTSNEYGKIDDFNSSHIDASPTLINSKCDGNSLQLDLKFPDLVHKEYGAPNEATILITNSSTGSIDIEVILFDKTPTRHPEGIAHHLQFKFFFGREERLFNSLLPDFPPKMSS